MPPPRRINRLGSLNKSALGRLKPGANLNAAKKAATCCDDPKIEDEDGAKICRNCYTQISESNIVSDVTFEEDSRGAATVQGGFIADNARHARTMGAAAYRRVGGGERNSLQEIEANGRRELAALSPRLGVPDTTSQQAASIWSLAAKQNFTAGRQTAEVIAACLYAACRRQKENTILLMDISENLKINVFRLGEVYKDLCKELYIDGESHIGIQHLVEVEPLILKYCRKLEFGDMTRQVAEDAVRIIRRMKRDWIVTGRHPAGLCGACIILAARMNNFRRSVREIVYVSKVADVTVAKRVEEFRRTQSAALTIDQFRTYGNRLKHQHDPPSVIEAELNKEKFEAKKRKRQAYNSQRESADPSQDGMSRESSVTDQSPGPESPGEDDEGVDESRKRAKTTQQPARFDSDGFAIPALPTGASAGDEGAEEDAPAPRRRGRPKKSERPEPVQITNEQLADERELEEEIEEVLDDPKVIETRNQIEQTKADERARLLSEQQKQLAAAQNEARRDALGINWWKDKQRNPDEVVNAEDLEAEFADDPEVVNCMLTDEESQAKEKIWVAFNEDWLRTQHEKELLRAISGNDGDKRGRKGAKGGRKKKRGKMGDGTLLAEAGTPIETPADANAAMLAKRAPVAFSRYVNYEALSRVYGGSPSASASRAPSEAPSERSVTPAPQQAVLAQATKQLRFLAPSPAPESRSSSAPATPAATEAQATAGAERDGEEAEEDETAIPDEDENEYRDDMSTYDQDEDDREEIGEDEGYEDVIERAALDESWGEYE